MNDIDKTVKDGCNLFESAFLENVSKPVFYNKHYNNPDRLERPVRFFYENETPVGMNAFMGMRIVDNSLSSTHYIAQSNDSAVLPEFRGRHVFSDIVTDFEENDNESEYSVGIPNDNSYNGFLKMSWMDVASLKCLTLKRSKLALLNQPEHISLRYNSSDSNHSDHEFRIESKFFLDSEELTRINKSSEIMTIRTNDYINWKISNKNAYVLSLYVGSEMMGYIIFHVIRYRRLIKLNHICIDDWYYTDIHKLNCLLERVCKWAYYIYIPFVNEANSEYRDFTQCGFEDLSKPSHFIVSPRAYGHEYLKRISFRMLDGDYILN